MDIFFTQFRGLVRWMVQLRNINIMSIVIGIKPLLLVGASGSGRSALTFHLTATLPHKFKRAISHTSRQPRAGEKHGQHFYFTPHQQMEQMQEQNKFLTFMLSPNQHYYALSKQAVDEVIAHSHIPICKMTLGAYIKNINEQKQLKKYHQIDHFALYINVPDMQELRNRLQHSPVSREQIDTKIATAEKQQQQAEQYFHPDNIIKSTSMEDTLVRVKSRLFELY